MADVRSVTLDDTRDLPSANTLRLAVRLLERESLRYTPAGLAICQALVEHASVQLEAGQPREVRVVMAARFSGVLAQRLADEALGSTLLLQGFLGARRLHRDGKPSGSLQIHVQQYRLLFSQDDQTQTESN